MSFAHLPNRDALSLQSFQHISPIYPPTRISPPPLIHSVVKWRQSNKVAVRTQVTPLAAASGNGCLGALLVHYGYTSTVVTGEVRRPQTLQLRARVVIDLGQVAAGEG